jgi:hypothetical protein
MKRYNDGTIKILSPQGGDAAKPQPIFLSLYRFIVTSFFCLLMQKTLQASCGMTNSYLEVATWV